MLSSPGVVASSFRQKLMVGQLGESLIARYLRSKSWLILPAYEKEIDNGKGPRLFLPYGCSETELIAPDLLCMRDRQIRWFEAKSKSTATFYRKKWRWQTGIDKRHYEDYKRVKVLSTYPVWLLFLQQDKSVSNAPPGVQCCPTGLYGCPIMQPYSDDGFYFEGDRRYDMVYWGINDLKKLASLEEVMEVAS